MNESAKLQFYISAQIFLEGQNQRDKNNNTVNVSD
jgi:hypothetical protein